MNLVPRLLLDRLDHLSLRERVLLVLGVPILVLASAELLVFAPARDRLAQALQEAAERGAELQALGAAPQPAASAVSVAEIQQLRQQRQALLAQLDDAQATLAETRQGVAWGSVLRAATAAAPGLVLAGLKTLPPEPVLQQGAAAVPTAAAKNPSAHGAEPLFRHRAELSVKGELAPLVAYLQALQRASNGLHWERLQLNASYPQATVQLNLYTLSNRAETPFD